MTQIGPHDRQIAYLLRHPFRAFRATTNVVWSFTLDGEAHRVWLEHGYWSGKRVVRCDGDVLDAIPFAPWEIGSKYIFAINDHECAVFVRWTSIVTVAYELTIDGETIEPEPSASFYAD